MIYVKRKEHMKMDFKYKAAARIAELTGLDAGTAAGLTETPPDPKLGDLAFPCFTLARTMRKAPAMIASELADKFAEIPEIDRVEAVGGYLNFFYNRGAYAADVVADVLREGADYGASDIGAGKTVVVEYSSPNIAKPFHIGHLFSTAVGSSLSKIYARLGYKVERINHLGDWGTQFGKLISAYKRWGDDEVIKKDPINELLKIYVKFHQEAKEHPELEDEAREYFKLLESGEEETTRLWQYFKDISLAEFKRVYDMLGVEFDSYAGESFYSDKMDEAIELIREAGLLTESEGAQVVDLSDMNMPPCIILKSDGATIYATRDIAAALYRYRTYNFDKMLYVVGTPQALHFKQFFEVMRRAGWDWADKCTHVGFGLVKFPDRPLSTRNGDVVLLEDVLNEALAKTREILDQSGADIDDKEDTAKKIGIGAVLYTFLKSSREKDIIFSWDSILDFDGESAPYCQYGYVRAQSILRRADTDYANADLTLLKEDDEYALIKQLADFGASVEAAADKNEPFYINRYVTGVVKQFNKFYNTCPILRSDVDPEIRRARLALTEATATVIKSALALLGIETVEKM